MAGPVGEQSLARTYNHPSVADPYDIVTQYRKAMRYGPDANSTRVARELEIPRGRVRPWLDDAKPDPVRGIEIATDRGWLDAGWQSQTMAALNVCIAWVFSGGSVDDSRYIPAFTTTARTHQELITATNNLGISLNSRNGSSSARATEYIPATDASVFGRLLASLGAPTGSKSERDSLALPSYLSDESCPYLLKLDFGRVVVRNRGTRRTDRPSTPVQLREERSQSYTQALRTFFGEVVGNREAIRGSPNSPVTFLNEQAAAVLCAPVTFGEYFN